MALRDSDENDQGVRKGTEKEEKSGAFLSQMVYAM